jgi:hypothetical protein
MPINTEYFSGQLPYHDATTSQNFGKKWEIASPFIFGVNFTWL